MKARLRIYCAIAAASFLPALKFYYVGEEAIFPISSLEMWRKGLWLKQLMYGADVQHNPLFNWLIMLASQAVGWSHVLEVTRFLALLSTLGSGWVLYRLAKHLWGDETFALFAALLYLTFFDVAFYHGWLAYVDPLFSFLVFSSIALLWAAAGRSSSMLLAAALFTLSLSFLAKAFTAYVFYAGAVFVLLFSREMRKFLLSFKSIAVHALAAVFPLFWLSLIPSHGQGGRMFAEIAHKLELPGFSAYLGQLAGFPLEVMLRMSPAIFLALYYLWRGRLIRTDDRNFRTALWIGLVGILPYWLSPQSGIRYIMPLYPFFALALAHLLWQSEAINTVIRWLAAVLVVKAVVFLAVFPWYQSHYRGANYLTAAEEIRKETAGFPLYTTDVSSSGLSVTGYLDTLRLPAAPLTLPPPDWQEGFVLSYNDNPALGKTFKIYPLGGDRLYLLCRGRACAGLP